MSEAIIVAAFSLIGTLGGAWMGVKQSSKLMQYRMDQLEAKVTKHNNLVERMVKVEASTKSAHHRIDELVHHERETEE